MGKKILIVDNQPVIREYLTNLLSREGYSTASAEDGLSALAVLRRRRPEILITDLVMPNIDGAKLCRIVRGTEAYRSIFVIVLSAIAAEERIDLARLGANACVAKGPLNKMREHLLAILSRPMLDPTDFGADNLFGVDEVAARQITSELLRSRRHAEIILANMTEGMIEVTRSGHIIACNRAAQEILGEAEENLLGRGLDELSFRVDGTSSKGLFTRLHRSALTPANSVFSGERQLAVRLLSVEDDHRSTEIVLLEDITQQKRAEAEISRSLAEKELLLKEVHHRVKNNLTMVASLITLQSAHLKSEDDVEVFEQLRDRINSISLVHEQLYLSDDLSQVDFDSYVRQLTANLLGSIASSPRHIDLSVEGTDVRLDINVVIPLGLVIAELFTNAVKHAFAGRQDCKVAVRLVRQDGGFLLTVEDNGVGLPRQIDPHRAETLGFQLVQSLALQLRARLTVRRSGGTAISLHFPLPRG